MDAGLFARMLSDKSIIDLKKLGCKYPQADLKEFVSLLDRRATENKHDLWQFVLTTYEEGQFSTK